MKLRLINDDKFKLIGIFGKVRILMRKLHMDYNLLNTHFDQLDDVITIKLNNDD